PWGTRGSVVAASCGRPPRFTPRRLEATASDGGPMSADESKIHLEADGAQLRVTGPDDLLTDDVVAALITDKVVLQMLVDVLRPVTVISARTPPVWPPRGGFVPAWRRVSPTRPLIVLPSEQVLGRRVDPFTAEPPTAPCQTCTLTQTTSAASEAI